MSPRGVYDRETLAISDRFWSKVNYNGYPRFDRCWLWKGAPDADGYGRFNVRGKSEKAHRIAYELKYGWYPAGKVVRHSCDTPLCVRPAHLIAGTQADNLADMYERGRNAQPRGERAARAKLSEAQVIAIRCRAALGATARQLSAEFGIAHQNIRQIIIGRAWKHVGEGAA